MKPQKWPQMRAFFPFPKKLDLNTKINSWSRQMNFRSSRTFNSTYAELVLTMALFTWNMACIVSSSVHYCLKKPVRGLSNECNVLSMECQSIKTGNETFIDQLNGYVISRSLFLWKIPSNRSKDRCFHMIRRHDVWTFTIFACNRSGAIYSKFSTLLYYRYIHSSLPAPNESNQESFTSIIYYSMWSKNKPSSTLCRLVMDLNNNSRIASIAVFVLTSRYNVLKFNTFYL